MRHITINNDDRIKIQTFAGMTARLLVCALILSSCQKYLDIQQDSKQKFIETADDCQRLLDNYTGLNNNYPSDGLASSDDYYLGTNIYPGTYTQESKDIYTWQTTAIHLSSNPQWLGAYQVVYYANLVLGSEEKIRGTTDVATLSNLKGAALFFRAFALWNVAQLYCKPYSSSSATDPGVPARTSADLNDVFGRGTVKETYDLIIQDLKQAVDLLNTSSIVPYRPNKVAAYAMLARVYLSMEDYGQALINASASIALRGQLVDYNTVSTTSNAPFTLFSNEDLFHSTTNTISNNNASTSANDLLLHPGSATAPRARINEALYNLYDVNDLRKSIYFKANSGAFASTYRFTGNYDASLGANLYNGLTIGEMYITRAECYARTGNIPLAMKDLNDLLVNRWKKNSDGNSTYTNQSATNETDALNIILAERRKELVMRGLRWTDLRRLNKDTRFKVEQSRTVTENGVTTTYTLSANDPRYTLLIPQEVINNNSNPQMVQNVH